MNVTTGLQIASPCNESWKDMTGDERSRLCAKCNTRVYSLTTLTTDEVRKLVSEIEGKVCLQFWTRHDGTVITRDCPDGLARIRRRLIAGWAIAAALALAVAAGLLREFGFWGGATKLVAWSAQLEEKAQPVEPLRAPPPPPTLTKKKMLTFGETSEY